MTAPVRGCRRLIDDDDGVGVLGAEDAVDQTLHANPGRHTGVPAFELESSERFFTRHLEGGASAAAG